MSAVHAIFSLSLGLLLASASPLSGAPKSVSIPLHRHFALYGSKDADGPLPLKVNGIESLVYTVDVQVGTQRFNLTLDTNAQASVLFSKGFVASDRSCSKGDAQRNLFDPSVSASFKATGGSVHGWYLYEYPYVGLECHQSIGSGQNIDGEWGQDTYQFGAVSVPEVPFILSNHTYYPLNPRWPSDGILPLGMMTGEALQKVFGAFGGAQEVSLFLNNARPSNNGPVAGGRITFGGKNTQDCDDSWLTVQSNKADWSFPLHIVAIGSYRFASGDYAELSTSTSFLEVPSRYFRKVVTLLGGKYSNDLDLYTVDCEAMNTLPAISITVNPVAYSVRAQDYIAVINGNGGMQCALLIVQGDDGWVVGTQFLPRRCVHLDYANSQIGFATPKNQ